MSALDIANLTISSKATLVPRALYVGVTCIKVVMDESKSFYINTHFEGLENDFKRARRLYYSSAFRLEGITVLICQIAALAKSRYPGNADRKAFKKIITDYSGKNDLYSNTDLLLFYQWPESKLATDKEYKKLEGYEQIKSIFEKEYGNLDDIRYSQNRYQQREGLATLLNGPSINGLNEENFLKYIELFSNNQIFYTYARCDAVHNNDFPLINIGTTFPSKKRIYEDNHQITEKVIVDTLDGILKNT
ncbi:MAG: hypothetical protein ACJAUP_002496 [Cellvibrionaceae bacterium]|jgi:hypothetical protein